jgi:hypothetical protein
MTKKIKLTDSTITSGFGVPSNYFSNIEEDLLIDLSLKHKVQDSGFKVPEVYFKTLEERVIEHLSTTEDRTIRSLFSWKKALYPTAAAAVVFLFTLTIYFNTSETFTLASLDSISIEDYLLNEDLTSYELSTLLSDKDLTIDYYTTDAISEDQLETYLLDNSDIESLITK